MFTTKWVSNLEFKTHSTVRIQYFQLREWSVTRVDRNHQRKIPAHGINFVYVTDLTKMILLEMITQEPTIK